MYGWALEKFSKIQCTPKKTTKSTFLEPFDLFVSPCPLLKLGIFNVVYNWVSGKQLPGIARIFLEFRLDL